MCLKAGGLIGQGFQKTEAIDEQQKSESDGRQHENGNGDPGSHFADHRFRCSPSSAKAVPFGHRSVIFVMPLT
jgi:hypothetical protein